jgi:hypothetical protein
MSGFKTYIPGLRLVLKTAHRFMTRYQSKLAGSLSPTQYTCLVSTIQAVADCLALLGDNTIVD